jgi:hypothetical protein
MVENTASAVDLEGRGSAGAGVPGVAMSATARTPEELETLFEDALLLRDSHTLAGLFEDGAVLVAGNERPAHGGEEIARLALATWNGDRIYIADPQQVTQARNTALIITVRGTNVVRRGSDGAWRYAIVRQFVEDGTGRSKQ